MRNFWNSCIKLERQKPNTRFTKKNIPAFSRIHPEPIDSEAPKETSPIDGLLFPVGHQGRLASVRLEVGL